ncbi:hypothetical protein M514_17716 [Trichuris suis]|uniref:Uncharacterized protein n=1 Tax=Trichuris suis TaxID=68888 RepID=A0A085NKW8_9BILA|nr:hypothetical protein M514_17716 [Trichuris suis]
MAIKLGVSQQSISTHLKPLGKVKGLDKWDPYEPSEKQMFKGLEVCSSSLLQNDADPFLHRIVTVDEKLVLYGLK